MKMSEAWTLFVLFVALGFATPLQRPLLAANAAGQPQTQPDCAPRDSRAIPLEFYGYTTGASPRRAFLRKGYRVLIAGEDELIEEQYRLVRIEPGSVVIEDTSNMCRQALPLSTGKANIATRVAQAVPNVLQSGSPEHASNAIQAVPTSQPANAGAAPPGDTQTSAMPRPLRRHRALVSAQR